MWCGLCSKRPAELPASLPCRRLLACQCPALQSIHHSQVMHTRLGGHSRASTAMTGLKHTELLLHLYKCPAALYTATLAWCQPGTRGGPHSRLSLTASIHSEDFLPCSAAAPPACSLYSQLVRQSCNDFVLSVPEHPAQQSRFKQELCQRLTGECQEVSLRQHGVFVWHLSTPPSALFCSRLLHSLLQGCMATLYCQEAV